MIYLVTSEEYSDRSTLEIVKEAVSGVDYVQMREKGKSREELLKLGRELKKICREVKFIVNDDPYLAKDLDADGVHVGQEDIQKFSIEKIREVVGDKIIGLSTHSLEQVREANELDIDYIGFGPVFSTQTKEYNVGLDDVRKVVELSKHPVFFIGGIKELNVKSLYELGAENIAVITAITKAEDVKAAIEGLKCN